MPFQENLRIYLESIETNQKQNKASKNPQKPLKRMQFVEKADNQKIAEMA